MCWSIRQPPFCLLDLFVNNGHLPNSFSHADNATAIHFAIPDSRLLVRLAGLWTLAVTGIYMAKMVKVYPGPFKHHRQQHVEKNAHRAYKIVKQLGQGGPMKYFLNYVHPFTRSLRIIVAAWRWIEAAQCRRGEVGTEEAMVCFGVDHFGWLYCFVYRIFR